MKALIKKVINSLKKLKEFLFGTHDQRIDCETTLEINNLTGIVVSFTGPIAAGMLLFAASLARAAVNTVVYLARKLLQFLGWYPINIDRILLCAAVTLTFLGFCINFTTLYLLLASKAILLPVGVL